MAKWIAKKAHVDDLGRYWQRKQVVEVGPNEKPPGLVDENEKYLGHFIRLGTFEANEDKMVPGNPHAQITPILEDLTDRDLRQKGVNLGLKFDKNEKRDSMIAKIRHKITMAPSSGAMQAAVQMDGGKK